MMLLPTLYKADIAIFVARILKTLFFGVAAVVAMPFWLLWLLCVYVRASLGLVSSAHTGSSLGCSFGETQFNSIHF